MEEGYERHYLKLCSGVGRDKKAYGVVCINID
jgi:hypothetical protein